MQIKEIGGEFALIERLKAIIPSIDKNVIVGVGDDAAVIKTSQKDQFLLVTTDMLIAGEHFDQSWSTPQQIGVKAVECNVSDIAAMGGTPTYMFISIALTKNTTVEWFEKLYSGISETSKKYDIFIAGGDTVRGPAVTLNITLLGNVLKKNLCLRSHAKAGDLLAITGSLGASAAGLKLHQQHLPLPSYLEQKFCAPTCRLESAQKIASAVNAMIDISDGLASEIRHICEQSKVGAIINENDIPIHSQVNDTGKKLNIDPMEFVLNGGEDYELLFSILPSNLDQLKRMQINFYVIGKITDKTGECYLVNKANQRIKLTGGFNHFL